MKKSVLFIIFFGLFLFTFLIHNESVFLTPMYEGGDAAADSILIDQAKDFKLLTGHYSRFQFNHPGPAILYVEALGEKVFYDWTKIVPAPYNAHLLSILILHSIILATLFYIFSHYVKYVSLISLFLLILFYFSSHQIIASAWIPDILVMIFFGFLVSTAHALAAKKQYWIAAIFGMTLIHGYVSSILFVGLIVLWFLYKSMQSHQFKFISMWNAHMKEWIVSLAVVFVFLLPILIHTLVDYPGEIGKYLTHSQQNIHNPVWKAMQYTFSFWSTDLTALAIIFALLLFVWSKVSEENGFFKNLVVLCGIITLAFVYYSIFQVDNLGAPYLGEFYYAVPLCILIVLVKFAMDYIENYKSTVWIMGILSIVVVITGNYTASYQGENYTTDIIQTMKKQPEWNNSSTIALDFQHDNWSQAIGLVINLNREGKNVCIKQDNLRFMFTNKYICGKDSVNDLNLILKPNPDASALYSNDLFNITR